MEKRNLVGEPEQEDKEEESEGIVGTMFQKKRRRRLTGFYLW